MHTDLFTGHAPAYIKRQSTLLITLTYHFSQTNPVQTDLLLHNTVKPDAVTLALLMIHNAANHWVRHIQQ